MESPDPLLASMAYDAVLRNLAVFGEAVRALPTETTDSFAGIPWKSIAGPRNVVIHEHFRIDPALLIDIVDNQLLPLPKELRNRLR